VAAPGKSNGIQLVVVGSIGIDTVATPAERREDLLGGSVSYACAAASYFSRVGMVGVVGMDFPPWCTDLYDRMGIDTAGLQRKAGSTFRWSGVYEENMIDRRTLSTELNVFEKFSPVIPGQYSDAPFLLLGNIAPGLQADVLKQVGAPLFVAADTMDLWIKTARDGLMDVISRVHLVTLNDGEARQLSGEHGLARCARWIMAHGPKYVVIKKGEHGAMLFSDEGVFIVPAYPVEEVRDPTGAGDAFAGGFMGRLAGLGRAPRLQDLREALLYGAVVASFVVEEFSLDGIERQTPETIESRMAALRAMIVP